MSGYPHMMDPVDKVLRYLPPHGEKKKKAG
jgi:hypothetical protein